MSNPLAPPPIVRPIRARDRRTGATLMLVPSASRPNLYHRVSASMCDCAGFGFRGTCSHLEVARREFGLQQGGKAHLAVMRAAGDWPRVSPQVAAQAAEYRSIFGSAE